MQTTIQTAARPPTSEPTDLVGLDIEAIRVPSERTFAARVAQHPHFALLSSSHVPADARDVRRRLMAESLRLSDTMAPDAYRVARTAQRVLGIAGEIELYQRSGAENASIHLVDEPILLEIQGSLLSLLDGPALLAVFGHELGHYLAHGPKSPLRPALALLGTMGRVELDRSLESSLSKLSMLAELTADRVGLLACQDLHGMLRLEMATLTGLPSNALTWDTEAYLAQSRDLMESVLADGSGFYGRTHPEHNLRAFALWLFSETDVYRRLTGRGPGTRELREVDGILARFFSDGGNTDRTEAVFDYSRLGEPPQELYECALAAMVIVAHADQEVADEEVAAIEKVFGSLVADWRTYLDLEVALERFYETAPVLVSAGPDLTRALFQLLVHVMGADGVVDVREVEMILAIGRALGVEADYRTKLKSVLEALRIDVSVQDAKPANLPLPARREDVASAFEAFLRGVVRRGETSISLRRLLRLLGHERRTDGVAKQIANALRSHGIETQADLDRVGLDERITLRAPATFRGGPPARVTVEPPTSRTALMSALRRMREQLVSGDGRSPSVRLRRMRRGRAYDLAELDRVSVGLAERVLAQIRGGKVARVVEASDAGRHSAAATAATDLLALAREHAARFEETGAHDLFLGYRFVTGNVGGYTVRAPLVLYPVDLERDGPGAGGYRLKPRRDEPPITNQSLLRLLFNKKDFAFSDELADELDVLAGDGESGPEAVRRRLDEVGLVTSHVAGALRGFVDRDAELAGRGDFLEIEEVAVLGLFPQSSSDLLQDYDGLLAELAQPRADVARLLASAAVLLPETLVGASVTVPLATPDGGEPVVPVTPADPSQRSVIAECRRHGAMVVDGPPGTGKSQVIVNLVASALGRGERVAVVCEKLAALDVVRQRLEALGLRHALGVVHDAHKDRKGLYAQIDRRLEESDVRQFFDQTEAQRVAHEHAHVVRALDARSDALRERPDGLGLSIGELYTLASSLDPSPLRTVPGLETVSSTGLRDLLERVVALRPLADVWCVGGMWRGPPGTSPRRGLAGADSRVLREIESQLDHALVAAQRYETLASACPVAPDALDRARHGLELARGTHALRADAADRVLFGQLLMAAAASPDGLRFSDDAQHAWADASPALLRVGRHIRFDVTPKFVAALSVLRHSVGSWLRFLALGWWLARFAFRSELTRMWPERVGEPLSSGLLDAVADRVAASAAWRTIGSALDSLGLGKLLPPSAAELERMVGGVARAAPTVRDVASARSALALVGAWPEDLGASETLERWDAVLDERAHLLEAQDALRAASKTVAATLPWVGELPTAQQLGSLLNAFRRDGARIAEADALIERARPICRTASAILDAVYDSLPTGDAGAWRTALTRSWADAWLGRLERARVGLANIGSGADDRDVAREATRLAELDVELRELEVERVLAKIDDADVLRTSAAEKHQRRSPEQKTREELLKETRKKRRLMALRSFVRKFAPEGLLGVVPVWLLSPETMAILFPRQPLFDLVIFDEASQCTVESGLPVLLRAKRVVIAGDKKQMPPSSYFQMGGGDEDVELEAPDEGQRSVRDLLGAESLLTLARTRVAHAGLSWHYRCRDESLIAFSNHAMYQGGLLTIPSTAGRAAPSALRWISVPDGTYDAGENKPEAERVVALVHELLDRDPAPSIGIITFNLKQRRAVLDAIDARSSRDQQFGELWSDAVAHDALDQRPFVKNLESVQGDERDVIVFSLGHAPQVRQSRGSATPERYVPARFGPLGQRGGERRLNVAISRAKAECYIVASFEPHELTVAASKNDGPKLFKQFLEYGHHMHHGRRLEADRLLELVRAAHLSPTRVRSRLPVDGYVPVAAQLGMALEAEGIPYELEVGASTFRVPLAVLDPADPSRFALGVLLDDGDTGGAFDLHVHRPDVLRQRGWRVLHVTPAAWHRRPSEIIEEICALVPGVRGAMHSNVYAEHRARLRKPVVAAPPRPRRPSVPSISLGELPPPAMSQPAWSLAIADPHFRRALVHLETNGMLGENELVNLVGGARRARAFARELETWRDLLPFRVEVVDIGGTKVYRNAGAR